MGSSASESSMHDTSGPLSPNTQPPYAVEEGSQAASLSAEEMVPVFNAGQQYITNFHANMSLNQGVGYSGTALHHQSYPHVAAGTYVNGCMGTRGADTNIVNLPRSILQNEPSVVPISTANPIANSAQHFNQYPVGSIAGLSGHHRVSTASAGPLQLASGPPPKKVPAVGTPAYYLRRKPALGTPAYYLQRKPAVGTPAYYVQRKPPLGTPAYYLHRKNLK